MWYYAMHTDNQSVSQYSLHIIVDHFKIENLRKMGHTEIQDLLHYLNN